MLKATTTALAMLTLAAGAARNAPMWRAAIPTTA